MEIVLETSSLGWLLLVLNLMGTGGTGRHLHELVPVKGRLHLTSTAGPVLFQIVEDDFTWMIVTDIITILFR